ncbi:hypothetical protein BN132_4182 [Cronobacter turicensis 564]|nr:hypothetical protein BN132_4182 [Cronobacter turicensis 564]
MLITAVRFTEALFCIHRFLKAKGLRTSASCLPDASSYEAQAGRLTLPVIIFRHYRT